MDLSNSSDRDNVTMKITETSSQTESGKNKLTQLKSDTEQAEKGSEKIRDSVANEKDVCQFPLVALLFCA